jgi:hypothetical protein
VRIPGISIRTDSFFLGAVDAKAWLLVTSRVSYLPISC